MLFIVGVFFGCFTGTFTGMFLMEFLKPRIQSSPRIREIQQALRIRERTTIISPLKKEKINTLIRDIPNEIEL